MVFREATDAIIGRHRQRGGAREVRMQVAGVLGVDERTVLRWAQHDASMPATRLGRVVRFERESLLRWLARKQPRSARQFKQVAAPGPSGAA